MNAKSKTIDTTYLSVEQAETRGFIHRDYIAHCLRWSHVIKRLGQNKTYAKTRLLDVGCGRELPLPTTLYSSRFILKAYYGVDYGPINDVAVARFHSGKFPMDCFEKTDVCDITLADLDSEPVNHVTCFEMAEHVEPRHLLRALRHVRSLMSVNGIAWFSTPCWDRVACAANHVNEMTYEAFGAVLQSCGFAIDAVHGTFASQRDYKHLVEADPKLAEMYRRLSDYYDSNYLSTVFAPMFPAQSRNCLWEVRNGTNPKIKWKTLPECEAPWGSSIKWEEMHE